MLKTPKLEPSIWFHHIALSESELLVMEGRVIQDSSDLWQAMIKLSWTREDE
jgi:hypothetical protein